MARPRSKQPELFGSPSEATPDWVTAYIDGGARGNPGPAGYGIVISDSAGATLAELSRFLGHRTNNYAEYSALIAALEWALAQGHRNLRIASDSELLVRQMKGIYKVKSLDLRPLYEQARSLSRKLERFEIAHVRREKNRRADKLANQAMDAGK